MAEDYQALLEENRQLKEQVSQLQEDLKLLEQNFDNMSEGYQESLLLFDTLQETYNELQKTNAELEVARQRAEESSRMKTDFIQQISHEIRTPLNILSGFTQIVTTPGMELDDATKAEVSKGITDNTARITGLVNKMLELADASSQAELERNDDVLGVQIAAQAADESCITMATHLTFDIQIGEGADMVMLHTNLDQSVRALSLLLDNAMKFTRPAEAALGTGAEVKPGKVLLSVCLEASLDDPSKQLLAFVVEDNGIGVPAEEAERIFDEFVQLDEYYDGTGIGLTVARSIARRLDGDIILDTSYTGGARFVMTLPV